VSPAPPPAAAPTPGAWTTLAVTLAIQSLVSMAALILPVIAPLIAVSLGRPAGVLAGLFAAAVYFGAILSSLLSGALVPRLGAIRASQAGMAMCAVGLLCSSIAWLPAMLLGSVLIGLGYGPITPASSHLLMRTTPARSLSLMFSIKQTGVPMGGLLAAAIAPALALWVGWQGVLWCVALASLVLVAAAQPLRAALDADRVAGVRLAWASLARPVRLVLSLPVLRRLAGCSFLFAIAQISVTAFLVTYLHEDMRMDLVRAGLLLSVAQAAGVVGRIAWGYVSDAWLGPRRTLTVLAVLMALSGGATALLPSTAPIAVAVAVMVAFGASAVGWNGVFLAEVARHAPPGLASAATGGTLVFTFLGNVLGPALFGSAAALPGGFHAAYACLALPLAAAGWALYRTPALDRGRAG